MMILTGIKCGSVQLLPPALEAGEVSSMCSFITRRTRLSLPLYYEMARGIVIALSFDFLLRAQLSLSITEWRGDMQNGPIVSLLTFSCLQFWKYLVVGGR